MPPGLASLRLGLVLVGVVRFLRVVTVVRASLATPPGLTLRVSSELAADPAYTSIVEQAGHTPEQIGLAGRAIAGLRHP